MVFVDRAPTLLDADVVLSNNHGGAREGVRHLLERGHRRIGYLGDLTTISTAQERWSGYREALREYDVAVDDRLVRHDLRRAGRAGGARCADELRVADSSVRQPEPRHDRCHPRASTAAQAARRGAGRLRRLPARRSPRPRVTVIAQDPGQMGTVAAQTLFERLEGNVAPTRRHLVPTELVERGSGEIAPPA